MNAKGWDFDRYKKYMKEYNKSDKGKEYLRKYNKSDKGKESNKKYRQSEKYKEHQKEYRQSEKYKASNKKAQNKYNNRLCCYNGQTLTFNALYQRFWEKGFEHPAQEARKYLL